LAGGVNRDLTLAGRPYTNPAFTERVRIRTARQGTALGRLSVVDGGAFWNNVKSCHVCATCRKSIDPSSVGATRVNSSRHRNCSPSRASASQKSRPVSTILKLDRIRTNKSARAKSPPGWRVIRPERDTRLPSEGKRQAPSHHWLLATPSVRQ
jgi:hypothetical protein